MTHDAIRCLHEPLAVVFLVLIVASCKPPPHPAPSPRAVIEHTQDDHFAPPPVEGIQQVMAAKLVHTQAIVEGLALADLEQVRANAVRLEEVSEESAWMVHDTLTYIVLSDAFRGLVQRMAEYAGRGDMDAVVVDYAALTNSCVHCHHYLQRERAAGQLPGRLSRLDWGDQ